MRLFPMIGLALLSLIAWSCTADDGRSARADHAPPAAAPSSDAPSRSNFVKVSVFNRSGKLVELESPRVVKTDAEWLRILSPDQFVIARNKGTEAPFCGTLLDNHETG